MAIYLKSDAEIEIMRRADRLVAQVLEAVRKFAKPGVTTLELDRLAEEGLTEEELDQTRQQVKGQIMLSLESTGARLFRLAGFALHEEPFITLDETLGRFDALTADEVSRVASEFFSARSHFLLSLGPAA